MFLGIGFGLLIGFASAIPIGPIGILAVSRRWEQGLAAGLRIGLVAAVMDVVYTLGGVQAAGLVTRTIHQYGAGMKLVGAGILIAVAVRLLRQARHFTLPEAERRRARRGIPPMLLALCLYLSGPTILAFWLSVAGLALAQGWVSPRWPAALGFALACGAGAGAWYVLLLRFLLPAADRLNTRLLERIFLVLALILLGIAGFSLFSAVREILIR